MAGTRSIEGIPIEQGVLDGLIAKLGELETELAATRDRLATLEAQHTQTVVRVTAQEGRRPLFGWLAFSVTVAATAGALLGRPVPVQAAPSLAALDRDIRLLKVAVNSLARRDHSLSSRISSVVLHSFGDSFEIWKFPLPALWRPFPEFSGDRRLIINSASNADAVMTFWTKYPQNRPATIGNEDLCESCDGVLPH